MVLGCGREPELPEDARHVLLDGPLGDDELVGDALVRAALGHVLEHLALARGQLVDGVVAAPPADELRDDRRVERRAALPHTPDRGGELAHVGDPVLEQVADALGALGEQLHRVRRLDVLGEDEHADLRIRLADLLRGPEAFVRVRRWHADVDDDDVRRVAAHLQHQVIGGAGLPDDLEALVLEQPRDALAQKDGILGEDYPHGISTRMRVPWPRGLSTCRRPSRASTRSTRPRSPEPLVGIGAAHPVVRDLDDCMSVHGGDANGDRGCLGVLGHVRERFGDDVVRGRLDRLGQALVEKLEVDRERRPRDERLDRGGQAAVGEHRGVDAARQLPQLLERLRELVGGLAEQPFGRLGLVVHTRLREAQHQGERDEALLRAVVEVALEPAALDVARLDDAGARAAQLVLVLLALGDVHPTDEQPRVPAVVAERRRRPGDAPPFAVRRDPVVLVLATAALSDDLLHLPPDDLALLGRDEDVPECVPARDVVVGAARQSLERRVEADDVAARRRQAKEARRRVDDRADEVALVLEVAVTLAELGVQPLELRLGLVPLRELAADDHRLVAGLDDPRLEVARDAVQLEPVLARDDLVRVDRAPDPREKLLGDLDRQHLLEGRSDQLLRRHGELLRRAVELEVHAVAAHPEDQVGERVEQRLDAGLCLGERREPLFVLERERGGGRGSLDEERVLLE